jgi:hypothetical protein
MITTIHAEIAEKIVRTVAIICIANMEYQLIITGQNGTYLLPVSFTIGIIAGVKLKDLKGCLISK